MPRDYGVRKGLEHPMFQPFLLWVNARLNRDFALTLYLNESILLKTGFIIES